MRKRIPARELTLEEENRVLRDLVVQFHHHLKVWMLLDLGNYGERAAWVIRGKQLQQDAEWVLPGL